jgi:hypothetical protein
MSSSRPAQRPRPFGAGISASGMWTSGVKTPQPLAHEASSPKGLTGGSDL